MASTGTSPVVEGDELPRLPSCHIGKTRSKHKPDTRSGRSDNGRMRPIEYANAVDRPGQADVLDGSRGKCTSTRQQ